MRLPLVAAAVASAASLALPADAAVHPVCGTQLVAAPAGTQKWCTTGNTPALTTRANRRFDVTVVNGVVDATIRCNHPFVTTSLTKRLTAPAQDFVRVTERIGYTCVATLAAVTDGATAQGESTYTYILVDPYPVP